MDLTPMPPTCNQRNIDAMALGRDGWIEYAQRSFVEDMGLVLTDMVKERVQYLTRLGFRKARKGASALPVTFSVTSGPPGTGKSEIDRFLLSLLVKDHNCFFSLNVSKFTSTGEAATVSVGVGG
jgi:hypothetical protein